MAANGDTEVDAMATDEAPPVDEAPPAETAAELKADTKTLEKAVEKQATDPETALEIFGRIMADESSGAEALRVKEQAIQGTGDILASQGKAQELRELLKSLRPFFGLIPKAKTAKIVRTIIDQVAKVPNSTQVQVELCKEQVSYLFGQCLVRKSEQMCAHCWLAFPSTILLECVLLCAVHLMQLVCKKHEEWLKRVLFPDDLLQACKFPIASKPRASCS